ncbi:kinase-like protein [Gigaspora margarita]|uniref:Kinase-like protein n=1 Tax=Gigaspora margarita TaxID=4874 RepID=A0A8H4AZ03_GIGMA|nr:kinase-like protein [Gigaspora margarita]
MPNIPEEWLERAISDGHINYLEYSKFTAPTIIGIGGFGTVLSASGKNLKLIRKVCYHPNIITFYGVTKENNGYYNIVLQYANDGNLREYLKANFPRLLWADKLRIAKEIVLDLLFLHNNDVIHGDLHSKNILIHHGQPQIADFGLSKQIKETSVTSSSKIHGILAYMNLRKKTSVIRNQIYIALE